MSAAVAHVHHPCAAPAAKDPAAERKRDFDRGRAVYYWAIHCFTTVLGQVWHGYRLACSGHTEPFFGVMAGLAPAIHVLLADCRKKDVDARDDGVPAA